MNPVKASPLVAVGLSKLFVLFIFAIILVYPWVKILEKAGKNKLLVLLMFIPFGILILPWYLALTEWKR